MSSASTAPLETQSGVTDLTFSSQSHPAQWDISGTEGCGNARFKMHWKLPCRFLLYKRLRERWESEPGAQLSRIISEFYQK
jgi:hypothetical protein